MRQPDKPGAKLIAASGLVVGEHALVHQAFQHSVERRFGKGQPTFQIGKAQGLFGLGKRIEQHEGFGHRAIARHARIRQPVFVCRCGNR
jgi:hypothetical protein